MPRSKLGAHAIRLGAVLVGIGACASTPAQRIDWAALSPGGSGDANAMVACTSPLAGKRAMAVGDDGSIFATGCGYGGWSNDFLTVKYAPDGSVLWSARYNGPADGDDVAYALALDSVGDVLVTGMSVAVNGNFEFATVKYAGGSGEMRWVARYRSPGSTSNLPTAVVVDPAGDVLVTGTSSQGGSRFATVKHAGTDGSLRWTMHFDGPIPGNSRAYALAVDAAGDVLVAGTSGGDFATVKYAGASGALLWVDLHDGPANAGDFAYALALDGQGDVLVTGTSFGVGSDFDYLTIKYAGASGVQQWIRRYDGPDNLTDQAWAVAVDAAGDVLVTGSSRAGTSADFATIKYDGATGAQRWTGRHDGPAHADDIAWAVATDATGDVLVSGWSGSGAGDNDYVIVKHSGDDGRELWSSRYDGSSHGDDSAYVVAVDAAGDVLVAGRTHDGVQFDFGVGKFSGTDGAPIWMVSEPVDSGLPDYLACGGLVEGKLAAAVDAAGNTVAVGCAHNGTDLDYQVVRFSPRGSVLWRAGYDGPASQDDWASAVTVDSAGDVIVTGQSTAHGSRADYATVKFAGSTGALLWVSRYAGPIGADAATAVTVDSVGNVLVTGRSEGIDGFDIATLKYAAATGAQLWVDRYSGPAGGDDGAVAIATDSADSALVTGYSNGNRDLDYVTIKYFGTSGQRRWASRYDGFVGDDQPAALVVDGLGNALVTGWSTGAGRYDYATIKLTGSDGDELWVARYDGRTGGNDFALAVAVDAVGDAFVSGLSRTAVGADVVTFKYDGATGLPLWQHQYDGPAGLDDLPGDLVIDAAGNAVVAGYSTEADGRSTAFTMLKLAGVDGSQRWLSRDSFGVAGRHQALAVDVAADGSLRVSGTIASASGARLGVLRIDEARSRMFADGFEALR